MGKLIFVTAIALFVSPTFVSAQEAGGGPTGAQTAYGGGTSTTVQVGATRNRAARPIRTSAFSRNVGPGSSAIGYGQDEMGPSGSGNTQNPRAPSANGNGGGGQ